MRKPDDGDPGLAWARYELHQIHQRLLGAFGAAGVNDRGIQKTEGGRVYRSQLVLVDGTVRNYDVSAALIDCCGGPEERAWARVKLLREQVRT